MQIQPYKGGDAKLDGIKRVIRLASNECSYGASPRAIEAIENAAREAHLYPDGGSQALRSALETRFGFHKDQLVCGSGSDEIISLLISAFVAEGEEVLYSQHGFLMYKISTLANGGVPKTAKEVGLKTSIENMLAAITEKTKMIFIANPNNPTGSYLTKDELHQLHAGIPENIILVVDAAYREYVTLEDYSDGTELVEKGNVVVTGTFSKLFGLGGLRVGWGYSSPEIIDILNRVRGPFNVNAIAQHAAIAALEDVEWQEKMVALNKDVLSRFSQRINGLGLKIYPSAANFVLVDFGSEKAAQHMDSELRKRGVITRLVSSYGLPSCLRITIGTGEEMTITADYIEKVLA